MSAQIMQIAYWQLRNRSTPDQSRSEPLQVSGSTSAGRVICGTDLAECVSVPGDFLRPQGAFPPGFYLLREGWVHCPAPEAPLTRGMPTGPRVFLTNSGRVWATALRPVPPKKRPCAIHARKVGRASNTATDPPVHVWWEAATNTSTRLYRTQVTPN